MAADGRKKRGWFGKIVIAGVALVALLAVALVLAPRFVNWEKVRLAAQTEGTKALGRTVEIRSLKVSLLSGVEIGGFSVGGAKGTKQPAIVKADRVVARYALLPLLWFHVVINRIELVGPKLWVGKDRKGKFSFADLTAGAPAAAPAARAKPVSLPVGVQIDTIRITGGELTFRDESGRKPFTAGIEKLDVLLRHFSLSGDPASLTVTCVANVDGNRIPVAVQGGFGVSLDRSLVTLTGMTTTVPGVKQTTDGKITEFQTLPTLDVRSVTEVDLAAVWAGYAGFIPKETRSSVQPVGHVTADVHAAGTAKKPVLEGKVSLKGVGADLKDLPGALENLEGTVSFTTDTLKTTSLRFIAAGSPFTVDAEFAHLGLDRMATFDLDKWGATGRFTAESPKVTLDRFLPPLEQKPAAKGAKPTPPPPPVEPNFTRLVPRGVVIDGTVKLEQIIARKVHLAKTNATVHIAGGNLSYTFEDGSYGSAQKGKGALTLTKFPVQYAVSGSLSGLDLKSFMDDAVVSFVAKSDSMQGRVSGRAAFDYDLTGTGVTFPNLQKHLKGQGSGDVTEGVMSKLAFLNNGLGKVLKLDWLGKKDLTFKRAGGHFTIEKGVLKTPDGTVDPGPDGDLGLTYIGTIGMDMKLKGEMATRFSPRHADEVRVGDAGKLQFPLEDGWAVGYWDVSGTVMLPILLPSKKHAAKQAQHAATQAVQKQVQQVAPKAEEQGKKLINNLFKKKKKK